MSLSKAPHRWGVFAAIFATAMFVATAAQAGPTTIPNGPWVQDRQHVSLERLHSNAELAKALQKIQHNSKGRVSVEVVGHSNEGRPIHLAKVGTGPLKVMYLTQQHGDEPLGTEAALKLLQVLGNGGAGWDEILSKITLLVIPRVNPDGHERKQRQNHDPNCVGAFCAPGVGFDINRYHDPAMTPENNPVPEAATVQRVFAQYRPAMAVDFHHQGTYRAGDNKMITTSVFWPNAPGVPAGAMALSRQMCVAIYDTMNHYGFAEVSQYPGTLPRGIARNAYGLLGAGSVLVEIRGGFDADGGIGQKSAGMLIRTDFTIMSMVLEAASEGSFASIDPARADEIPMRGPYVPGPNGGEEDDE